ncbi:MAG: glycerol-3-phosphate acyltransferase, partial [Oscillospiraceae bacterium]|nr:glycerol-3-phosphate acyltransferase [Oscillospiraceae bacterium]
MIYRKLAFIFIVSYLIGSLSFAIIISKVFYKKDIRTFGSGNAGMTNMLRTFGKGAAAATFIGDFLKGTVSVVFARM